MKKEIIIGCLLVIMLAAAFVNIHYLNKLTDDITHLIEESGAYAEKSDWVQAEQKAEEAAKRWSDSESYTHLVLRHSELESTTDAIYGYMERIYAREKESAKGAAQAAISRLKSISSIEKIKPGSIF
ncbi:MAG: DUF4363 family protein [Clostridiales bacterium]|nr:DUF4363 family protein [Clostridiales bacterium]